MIDSLTKDTKLTARFRVGDIVRWNALALHGDDRNGWTVQGLDEAEGLLPSYHVKKGKKRGSAMQHDLEPCPTHARLQREAAEETATLSSNNRLPDADLQACRSWLAARGDSLARSGDMILIVDELLERRAHETPRELSPSEAASFGQSETALREIIYRAVHDEDFDIHAASQVACIALDITPLDVISGAPPAQKANVCTGCNSTPCICSELKANERQCNHSLNQGTTLVREGDKLTCSVCKVLWKDFGAIDKADELCPHGNVEANCAGCAENGEGSQK